MPRLPNKQDPEGVDSMSPKELREMLDRDTRTKMGWPPAETRDPDGVDRPQEDEPRVVNP